MSLVFMCKIESIARSISLGDGDKGAAAPTVGQKSVSLGQIFQQNNRKFGQKVYNPLNMTSSYTHDKQPSGNVN